MKILSYFLLIVCLLIGKTVSAQENSTAKVLDLRSFEERKKVILFKSSTEAVGNKLEREIQQDKNIRKILDEEAISFISFDAFTPQNVISKTYFFEAGKDQTVHAYAKYFRVSSLPSLAFVNEYGQVLALLQGYFTAKELMPYFRQLAGRWR